MTFITDIIKGMFIGIANIIPGVSGFLVLMILGLILSSPFAILYNTGLIGQLDNLNLLLTLSGVIFAIVGGMVTYFLGENY